jgi:hypothetical protein
MIKSRTDGSSTETFAGNADPVADAGASLRIAMFSSQLLI